MYPIPLANDSEPTTDSYYPIMQVEPDPVQQWLRHREHASTSKLRSPLVLGSHRIRLAAERCRDIQEQLDITRMRLLNPGGAEGPVILKLEERAMKLAAELHAERLGLWKDLGPLLEQVSDSTVDAMRVSLLESIVSSSNGGDGL